MATASAGGADGPFAATSLALGDARVAARLPKPDCAFGPDRTGPNRTGPDRAGPGDFSGRLREPPGGGLGSRAIMRMRGFLLSAMVPGVSLNERTAWTGRPGCQAGEALEPRCSTSTNVRCHADAPR